jgi:hypothetical protein
MSASLALIVSGAALAQGNSGNGGNNGNSGKGNGGSKGGPPSSSVLPSPSAVSPAAGGTVPFAWIDDASVLPQGDAAFTISAMRWSGSGISEVDAPVVGAAVGLSDRVQLGASIPHVTGSSDPGGAVGGLGTTFISAKIGVLTGETSGVKLAVAPTLEVLGTGALSGLTPGESRGRFGIPISAEISRGAARLFASTGFFTGGVWFAGGGVGVQANTHLSLSAAFSRAWTSESTGTLVGDRRELSGGVGYQLTSRFSAFGSLSRTIATSDQDGAGTTVSGGVLVLLVPSPSRTK